MGDFENQQRLTQKAKVEASQSKRVWQASMRMKADQQAIFERARKESKEVAEDVAKELIFNHAREQPNYEELLAQLRDKGKSDIGFLTNKFRSRVEKESAMEEAAQQQDNDKIDPAKVSQCTSNLSSAVRENVANAFSEGNAANGCALLSLASNELLRKAYLCICMDGGGGGPQNPA